MITAKEAMNKVLTSQGYKWPIRVKDYDKQHYVCEALPEVGKLAIGAQTTFGVDKNTGEVTAFMLNDHNNLDFYIKAVTVETY
jgi:hypothetical protein